MSDSVRPQRWQPTRLPHPWDSPGKNTGVGCHFLLQMHESEKWKWSRSVLSDSSWPHGLQPTKFLHPWEFPGKSTRVGCHCLPHPLALHILYLRNLLFHKFKQFYWGCPLLHYYKSLDNIDSVTMIQANSPVKCSPLRRCLSISCFALGSFWVLSMWWFFFFKLCNLAIMASSPITSWEIDGKTWEIDGKNFKKLYFFGLQNHCRWWLQPWN